MPGPYSRQIIWMGPKHQYFKNSADNSNVNLGLGATDQPLAPTCVSYYINDGKNTSVIWANILSPGHPFLLGSLQSFASSIISWPSP